MKYIVEIFSYKDLLLNLVVKELKLKYKDSLLGIAWSLFNPLMMMIIYTIAFRFIMKIEIENYSVFVFTGLLAWSFFQMSVSQSATSIINNSGLVGKVYFPKIVLPLSIIISNFINLLLTLIILFVAIIYFDISITFYFLLLPFILLFLFMFVVGFSLIITTLNTKYRDIAYLMEVIFTAWFYLTPIIYPSDMVPDSFEPFFIFNPLAAVIESLRDVLLYGKLPGMLLVTISVISSTLILLVGVYVFKRREKHFVDDL